MAKKYEHGYTAGQAATMTMSRLHKDIKIGHEDYAPRREKYLKTFYHYRSKTKLIQVGTKEISNSFVEAMITYWSRSVEEKTAKFTPESIEDLMENPAKFIDKTRKSYSQIKTTEILGVSRQTLIHWMNRGILQYIIVGIDRKPLKSQVDKMVPYKPKGRKKEDSTAFKAYFQKQGLWFEMEKGDQTDNPILAAKEKIATLESQVAKLEADLENVRKSRDRTNSDSKKIGKSRDFQRDAAKKARGERDEYKKQAAAEKREKNRQVAALQKENVRLEALYQESLEENTQLEARVSELESTLDAKPDYGNPLQSDEYAALKEQRDEAQATTKTLKGQLKESDKGIKRLEKTITSLEKKYNTSEDARKTKVAELRTSESARKKAEKAQETLLGKLEKAEQTNTEYKVQIQAYEKQAKEKGKEKKYDPTESPEYAKLNAQFQGALSDIESLRSELGAANAKISGLEAQVSSWADTFEDTKSEPEVPPEPDNTEIDELHDQIDELNTGMGRLQAKYDATLTENEQLKSKAGKREGPKKEGILYQPSQRYKKGERIFHAMLEKTGKVLGVEGTTIKVYFEGEDKPRSLQHGKPLNR